MGWAKKKSQKTANPPRVAKPSAAPRVGSTVPLRDSGALAPELPRRRTHQRSALKSGRTIAATREHLETASQRQAAHRKSRRRQRTRLVTVSVVFGAFVLCMVALYFQFRSHTEPQAPIATAEATPVAYQPTIEIVDEDGATIAATGGGTDHISSVTRAYIGQAEQDFRDLGYIPVKAVLPTGSIRQVNFYLANYPGYVKFYTDRPTAESVEDADRLIRYLRGQGITTYDYLDVRLPGKAYWK